jgi:hypothetical protein
MSPLFASRICGPLAVVFVLLATTLCALPGVGAAPPPAVRGEEVPISNDSAVGNFSAAIGRLVELVGVAGSGLLALVWARVALSWFSHDISKKVQAKDRARDALVGSLIFVAALTGLVWGLAHWVLTGS